MLEYDFIIVGSGLTGSTIGRILHDSNYKVLVIERRNHLGGNVFDHMHESGIRVHTYGPHYFRTSDEKIWKFVNRFSSFYEYIPSLKSLVDSQYENWPISASYIKRMVGSEWMPSFRGVAQNFEEAALSMMPEGVYHKFVKGYNIKQWGVDPQELSKSLITRFDVRLDDDPRLMPKKKYQGIPTGGYSSFMSNMLEGIPVLLNCDYLKNRDLFKPKFKIIYTGPIDAFFSYCFGKLKYRGQKRVHEYFKDADYLQPCGQVNNPQLENGPHIRSLEWKHMMNPDFRDKFPGTLITKEITYTPHDENDYEYPFPDSQNQNLFRKYQALAQELPDVLICGRLGEYKYYDMDQCIGRAMRIAKTLLSNQEL
jgi:UDP-galactopyranose mutase